MISERGLLRRAAVAFSALYVVLVAGFALLKALTPRWGAVAWAEIVYGPAITVFCGYLLFYVAVRVECLVRDRKGGGSPDPPDPPPPQP